MVQWDTSEGKSTFHLNLMTWALVLNNGKTERTLKGCPLTSKHRLWHMQTHTHTHKFSPYSRQLHSIMHFCHGWTLMISILTRNKAKEASFLVICHGMSDTDENLLLHEVLALFPMCIYFVISEISLQWSNQALVLIVFCSKKPCESEVFAWSCEGGLLCAPHLDRNFTGVLPFSVCVTKAFLEVPDKWLSFRLSLGTVS